MTPVEKLSRILRADRDYLIKIDAHLSALTGKRNVIERVVHENERQIAERLLALGVSRHAPAKEVYDALISKIEADDARIFAALRNPSCAVQADCARALEAVCAVSGGRRGFFLRRERTAEFLRREPPKNVMGYLGYASVEDMLAKEDLVELMCALRFIEGNEWLNNTFFKQYRALTPRDFEERAVEARALSPKWNRVARRFVRKKWHNISHLKELGVVFVIPIALGISGELLRMLSLVLHYLHEVPFYADLFKKIAEVPTTFTANLTALLRGDVFDRQIPEGGRTLWLVVQRYLAKDDVNDWRLSVPRISPEALHWQKAEEDLVKLAKAVNGESDELGFWRDLDWVGDYFRDEAGNEVLVSFNLVDTVMSLVKEKELMKYLYHHQEALWNKIFISYFSRAELEAFAKEYLLQGYFEI